MAEPRRILVIEGDDNLRPLLALALTLHGFAARDARNGMEALAMLECHTFDGVVLDVLLPDIDGASIRQEIAAQPGYADLPVVIIAEYPGPLDHLRAACLLRKPVTPTQVAVAVERCLEASRTRSSLIVDRECRSPQPSRGCRGLVSDDKAEPGLAGREPNLAQGRSARLRSAGNVM